MCVNFKIYILDGVGSTLIIRVCVNFEIYILDGVGSYRSYSSRISNGIGYCGVSLIPYNSGYLSSTHGSIQYSHQ